jgi:hypothetical protein
MLMAKGKWSRFRQLLPKPLGGVRSGLGEGRGLGSRAARRSNACGPSRARARMSSSVGSLVTSIEMASSGGPLEAVRRPQDQALGRKGVSRFPTPEHLVSWAKL